MKRWNDILAPFSTVFTGARASLRPHRGLTLTTSTTNESSRAPYRRATSDNYFYGLSYEDRNGKYEDRLQSLIFSLRANDEGERRNFTSRYYNLIKSRVLLHRLYNLRYT